MAKRMKNWKKALLNLLNEVEPLGTFATTGPMNNVPLLHPIVNVDGVGILGLPFIELAVEPLKAVASMAPFGLGAETLYDESVRKAWQVEASKVTLEGGTVWTDYMKILVNQACRELGLSQEQIDQLQVVANLYKLLVYEQGGHFKVHRDTEKEEGMFATLIIQLPSEFTGGALTVSHQGETKTFELSKSCESQFRYIAFYADCEHQLHPVTSGVRICLVFNLVALPSKEVPKHSVNVSTETSLRSIASNWSTDDGALRELGYPMGHRYTPQSFGLGNLKGRDAIVLQTLLNAKSSSGRPLFNVDLLLMQRYVEIRDCDRDDEQPRDEISPLQVYDRHGRKRDATGWTMYKDRSTGWMINRSDYQDLYGSNDSDNDEDERDNDSDSGKYDMFSDADIEEFHGYAGNESGTDYQWYYAAAIVISPTERPAPTFNANHIQTLRL